MNTQAAFEQWYGTFRLPSFLKLEYDEQIVKSILADAFFAGTIHQMKEEQARLRKLNTPPPPGFKSMATSGEIRP